MPVVALTGGLVPAALAVVLETPDANPLALPQNRGRSAAPATP